MPRRLFVQIINRTMLICLCRTLQTRAYTTVSSNIRAFSFSPSIIRYNDSSRRTIQKRRTNVFTTNRPGSTATFILTGIRKLSVLNDNNNQQVETEPELSMENIYMEWTVEDDRLLYENRNESTIKLASILGRGIRGVEARLAKLCDVDSFAYQRLFVGKQSNRQSDDEAITFPKLIPASEVIRRIRWDPVLVSDDFSILHYDRIEDKILESPMNAPNDSISGKAQSFVDALPEHRIVAIKYKEQIVWDREKRMDLVFGENGGIRRVIQDYDEWKQRQDDLREWNRQRRAEVGMRMEQIIGSVRKEMLQKLSTELQSKLSNDPRISTKLEAEQYVNNALQLFREARVDITESGMTFLVPSSDYEALDVLSEFVVLLPDPKLRDLILTEVDIQMKFALSKNVSLSKPSNRPLPTINDDDIIETFVRGSGPGGQKINKTSNRVVLVHKATQIRVECQETRSLQQNRKIARKLLQVKLEEHLYGSQSRSKQKASAASTIKAKAKAKSKARLLKKQQDKLLAKQSSDDKDSDDDDDDWIGTK